MVYRYSEVEIVQNAINIGTFLAKHEIIEADVAMKDFAAFNQPLVTCNETLGQRGVH